MTRRIITKILLVVIAAIGLFVLSGVLLAEGNSQTAFQRAKAAQERHTERLMALNGVVGTAIGSGQNGEPTVAVLLERPGVAGIAQTLDGVPVKVVVTGKISALSTTDRFDRPVPIGVSTGHPAITAGTIGCRVTDGTNVYALSNNHVFANENNALIGDNVLQPGPYDGGVNPDDAIGTLADFEPIVFSRKAKNVIDAAIALSSTDLLDTATPAGGYGTPNSVTAQAFLGQNVQKFGRTTGLTKGAVTAVNATVTVGYGPGKTARFVKQIIIEPGSFSGGGDSGSLIVTDDDNLNPIGLLFAGSSTHTIANPIDLVLSRFGVTVDDGQTPTQNDPPTVSITSPADGSTFESGAVISFEGTAYDTEDGDLTANLVWTSDRDGMIGTGGSFSAILSDGNHIITASVTDSGGKTTSGSWSITVIPEPSGAVFVAEIKYATVRNNRDLVIGVKLVDDQRNLVSGASVSISIFRDGAPAGSVSGTTDTYGWVTFTLKNAKSGTYTTQVTAVTAAGLTWNGETPPNQFIK
ncbi:MAG: Ig-like domain-containing protein [Sedimentisphaerales bacterium]|nr:Ig-like domain-containing protein [Sedimentisphaerales bacterium]